MTYEYKSVAFNALISVKDSHDEVTLLYDEFLNKYANIGWEFHSIDEITTHKARGCFSEPENSILKIMIFRRKHE